MAVKISCIVEGDSELESVPVLIRRVSAMCYPGVALVIPRPIRIPRNRVIKIGELERAVELAARKIRRQGAIFIILDSDRDCPAHLGPKLLQRVLRTHRNLPVAVVLAKCEFEAWFLAAAESLRGQRGLRSNIYAPNDPEAICGAKEWLSQHMQNGKTYKSKRDQPALAAIFDIEQARRSNSFDKCYREIVRLLGELREPVKITSKSIRQLTK